MKTDTLHSTFIGYQTSLESWCEQIDHTEQDVLQILKARDNLHQVLKELPPPITTTLIEIQILDKRLLQQAPKMSALLDFKAYRQGIPISPEQWWWTLDEQGNDWVFNGFTLATWTVSLALLIDISVRFLLGSSGVVGLSAVILPSLLTLVKARNDFTEAGQKSFQKLIDNILPSCNLSQAKFGCSVLLTLGLSGFWISLPSISRHYNHLGQTEQQFGQLGTAEENYHLAISLDPDNNDAHYNLGTLYENIQDLEKAKTQYLIAASGDIPEAYNNLARLHLQIATNGDVFKERNNSTLSRSQLAKTNLSKAVALLNQGLQLVHQPSYTPQVRYSLYKNLGWARLQQNHPQVARPLLQTAIQISQESGEETILNSGSAYCLLAQAIEVSDSKTSTALPAWQRCCQLGNSSDPDEDIWMLEAQKLIKARKLDPNQLCRPNAKRIT